MRAVARIKSLPTDGEEGLSAEPGLSVRPVDPAATPRSTWRKLSARHQDRRRRVDAVRQGARISRPTSPRSRRPARSRCVTGNYDPDLNLLIKAGVDAGLDIRYDAYLAHLIGGPTAIGAAGDGRLTSVMEFHDNVAVGGAITPRPRNSSKDWRANARLRLHRACHFVTHVRDADARRSTRRARPIR